MKLFTKYRLFLQIWSLIFISFLGNPITSYSAFTDRTVEEKMEDMREKARRPLRAESEKIKEQLEREKRERPEDQSHFLSQLTQVISQPTVAEERVSAFQSEGAQAEFWRSLYEQERAKLGRFEEAGEAETERSGGECLGILFPS